MQHGNAIDNLIREISWKIMLRVRGEYYGNDKHVIDFIVYQ